MVQFPSYPIAANCGGNYVSANGPANELIMQFDGSAMLSHWCGTCAFKQARGKYCEHVHDVQEQVMQTTGSGMWASPVVEDSSFMNERVAFRIVPTCQMGFQHSGWKSLKEKHIFVFGLNLPDGVINRIPGGLNG